MIKVIGSIFVITGFVLFGKTLCDIKRYRLDFLEKMIFSLSKFEAAISLYRSPIKEALKESGIKENEKLLNERFYSEIQNDKNDLYEFIKGLEAESLEGQKANLIHYKNKLSEEEKRERTLYKNTARLLRGASVMLGFLFVFLLM